jgi:glycine/D-amino acid oxidase-like deaminating enzyme/nitrite reductase/ring-hydroxylating ferredoxin subunit
VASRIPLNRPFWLEDAGSRYPSLSGDVEVDVAVVGAGITGVTTAYLLKQAGKSVALLEQSSVGFGATGYTTAKLTVGHSLIYRDLAEQHGEDAARLYARSNQEAIERIVAIVAEHDLDCDLEGTSNFVYTESESSVEQLEQEVEAAQAAGVEAVLTTETDLPYPVTAAVRVDDQAQFHPWKYLAALARLVDGDGSRVFESTRVSHVAGGDPCVVEADGGRVRARHVVVATQLPFLDRGLFFAKAHPTKSYAVAAAVDGGRAPHGMYISVDQPTRSVRSTPAAEGGRLLIVGGESHKPGTEPDTSERYAQLERFLAERFDVGPAAYRWSTHDYMPVDRLPYIGRLRRGDDRVLVATGFAKWGMTKGTLAARMLADAILGQANPYADLYDAKRLDPLQSATRFAKENGFVGLRFLVDRVRPREGSERVERLQPGAGAIVREGAKLYAVHRDDAGELHVLSARCTHMGCIVGWNAADRAWECPCHGSRFAGDGTLVQGPATADLPRRALPD